MTFIAAKRKWLKNEEDKLIVIEMPMYIVAFNASNFNFFCKEKIIVIVVGVIAIMSTEGTGIKATIITAIEKFLTIFLLPFGCFPF